jgi:hypothetical protein
MHRMNIVLFTLVLAAHSANIFFRWCRGHRISAESMGPPWTNIPTPTRNVIVSGVVIFLRAIVDIISIAVLRRKFHRSIIVSSVPHRAND